MKEANDGSSDGEAINNRRSYLAGLRRRVRGAPSRSEGRQLALSGRRGFLKKLSAIGISIGTLQSVPLSELAEATGDSKDRVPYISQYQIKNRENLEDGVPIGPVKMEPVVSTVPREKWARIEAAHRVSERLYKRIQGLFDDPSISVGVTPEYVKLPTILVARRVPKGMASHELPVSNHEIRAHLPETASITLGQGTDATTVEGLEVGFREFGVSKLDHNPSAGELGHFAGPYRPDIPGGCEIRTMDPDHGQVATATTAQPVYNPTQGKYRILTAGHNLVSPDDIYDFTDVYQPASDPGGLVGCRRSYEEDGSEALKDINGDGEEDKFTIANIDGGAFDLSAIDGSVRYNLATDDGGYGDTITGHWTWDEIKYKEDTNGSFTRQGRTTKRESGDVFYTDPNKYWFATYAIGLDGDSGGPYYATDSSGELKTAGVVSTNIDLGYNGTVDGTGGNYIDHILSTLGLRFI